MSCGGGEGIVLWKCGGGGDVIHFIQPLKFPGPDSLFLQSVHIGVNLSIVDPIISTGFPPKTSAVVTYLLACLLFFQLQLNFIFEFFCLFLFPKEYFQ